MDQKQNGNSSFNKNAILIAKLLAGIIIGVIIARLNPPAGLTVAGMRFLGIFACVVLYLLLEALPTYALALLLCSSFVIFKVVPFATAFGQFAGDTMVLLIGALGIGAGISKSGLLNRLTLNILKIFPGSFRGQVLAFLTAGTVVGPFIPSNTAKLAIAAPFGKSVAEKLGFDKESKGSAGLFSAIWIAFGNAAPMFLSASVWCYLILGMVPAPYKAQFTWGHWLACAWPWGLVVLVGSYFAIMFLYKPQNDNSLPDGYAKNALAELGPMTWNEKVCAAIMVIAVAMWMTERVHGIAASVVAVAALGLMLSFKLLDIQDIRTRIPWDMIIFIGGILNLAALFTPLKIDTWLGNVMGPYLAPLTSNIFLFVFGVSIMIYLIRFVVLSQMATFTVFSIVLIPFAIKAGFNPWIVPFIVFVSTNVWNLYFQHTIFLATLSASGDMTTHRNTVKMSIAYMLLSTAGLLLSVPVWKLLGLVP